MKDGLKEAIANSGFNVESYSVEDLLTVDAAQESALTVAVLSKKAYAVLLILEKAESAAEASDKALWKEIFTKEYKSGLTLLEFFQRQEKPPVEGFILDRLVLSAKRAGQPLDPDRKQLVAALQRCVMGDEEQLNLVQTLLDKRVTLPVAFEFSILSGDKEVQQAIKGLLSAKTTEDIVQWKAKKQEVLRILTTAQQKALTTSSEDNAANLAYEQRHRELYLYTQISRSNGDRGFFRASWYGKDRTATGQQSRELYEDYLRKKPNIE